MDKGEVAAQAADDVWVTFVRMRRRLLELAGEGDLTPGQASVLARLDKGGPTSASDLAVVERVRPQSMAKIVMALEQAGLVERHPDRTDGRRQLVSLTARGREHRLGHHRTRQEWLAHALDEQCTTEQLLAVSEVMGLLDRVAQSPLSPLTRTERP